MQRSSAAAVLGGAPLILGTIAALVNMDLWFSEQASISSQTPSSGWNVLSFFVVQGISVALIFFGIFLFTRRLKVAKDSNPGRPSTAAIIADAISTRNGTRILILAALVYAMFYLFVSSILVYQPTVDFASTYGVSQPGWNFVVCCGSYGTIPTIIVYLSPQLHLGMQVIPLDLVLVSIIPPLVGINASIAYYALKNRPTAAGMRWFSALGAFVGLFTACPTCAGLFLASVLGGFGATTLALSLAPFQSLFLGIAVPTLAIAPVLTARNISGFIYSSCKLPEQLTSS